MLQNGFIDENRFLLYATHIEFFFNSFMNLTPKK